MRNDAVHEHYITLRTLFVVVVASNWSRPIGESKRARPINGCDSFVVLFHWFHQIVLAVRCGRTLHDRFSHLSSLLCIAHDWFNEMASNLARCVRSALNQCYNHLKWPTYFWSHPKTVAACFVSNKVSAVQLRGIRHNVWDSSLYLSSCKMIKNSKFNLVRTALF